jgi:hypothetical protein
MEGAVSESFAASTRSFSACFSASMILVSADESPLRAMRNAISQTAAHFPALGAGVL